MLRFARRLALESKPEVARSAVVRFVLDVVPGDAALLVARSDTGDLEIQAHFGASLGDKRDLALQLAGQAIANGDARLHCPDPSRRKIGRIAAAPLRLGDRRGALVLTRLSTHSELHEVSLVPLWLVASLSSEALRRTDADDRLDSLQNHMGALASVCEHGVAVVGLDGRIAHIDARAARVFGGSEQGLVGQPLAAVAGGEALARVLGSGRMSGQEDVELGGRPASIRFRRHRRGAVVVVGQSRSGTGTPGARYTFDDLLTQDPAVLRAIDAARQTAQSAVPLLITGPSGTGKEVLAQAVHNASPRASEPFVAVNVAAIPAELLESELFGYEAGAFTGAHAGGRPGAFEQAGLGTLLLDEIGEMPVGLQTRLLRVLQEREVRRLGGTAAVPVHARVLATTNRDLEQLVNEGRFRLDLFYRLRVVSIELPPLRERPGDVPLLAEYLLGQACKQLGRSDVELTASVLDQLVQHEWPGNIRELSNLLLGVVSLLPEDERTIAELPVFLSRPDLTPIAPARRRSVPPQPPAPAPPKSLEDVERDAILRALEYTNRNMSEAARILGISRTTLYKKVKDLRLEA